MAQNIWHDFTLGKCYEIRLKDGRIYRHKEDGQKDTALKRDLDGVDIDGSDVTEISCDDFSQSGFVGGY